MTRQTELHVVLIFAVTALAGAVSAKPLPKGDATAGAKLFAANCTSCHGPAGKGDGPAAVALVPKPRDLTDAKVMAKVSDQALFDTIQKGGAAMKKSPVMPAFSQLKPPQIADLVAHIRALCKCRFTATSKKK